MDSWDERYVAACALEAEIARSADCGRMLSREAGGVVDGLAALLADNVEEVDRARVDAARALLGRLRWYRYQGGPPAVPVDIVALRAALDEFRAVLLAAHGPERAQLDPLWGDVAGFAEAHARSIARRVRRAEDAELCDAHVAAWRRLVRETPEGTEPVGRNSALAVALAVRFALRRAPADIEEATALGRAAVAATGPGHPGRAHLLANLGTVLFDHYDTSEAPADLDEVIAVKRAAVESAERGHAARASLLADLSLALQQRYRRSGTRQDAEEAVALGRAAVASVAADDEDKPRCLMLLASALNLGDGPAAPNGSTGIEAGYEEVVALARAAADAAVGDAYVQARCLADIGEWYQAGARQSGLLADLDGAAGAAREAVDRLAPDDPYRAGFFSGLAYVLTLRYRSAGDVSDLADAVAAGRAAVRCAAFDRSDRAVCLLNLANALHQRFGASGDGSDLDEAVQYAREAAGAVAPDHPHRAKFPSLVGLTLYDRHTRTGSAADLDEAIAAARAAVEAAAPDYPDRLWFLSRLVRLLYARHGLTGSTADLDEAVRSARIAASAAPATSHRPQLLAELATALETRYALTGTRADLDEAVEARRAAVGGFPGAPPEASALARAWLARMLVVRYYAFRAPADLDEAIEAGRSALDGTGPDDPERANRLANLGHALNARHDLIGSRTDLDEAVMFTRAAVEATPSGDPQTGARLMDFAVVLRARHQRSGAPADFDELLDVLRVATAAAPPGEPGTVSLLILLGTSLMIRYERSQARSDLEEAAGVLHRAVDEASSSDPSRENALATLAHVLAIRFHRTGAPDDLAEAIRIGRAAESVAAPSAARPMRTPRLGRSFARIRRVIPGLGAGPEAVDGSARIPAPRTSMHATRLVFLSAVLEQRYRASGTEADLEQAVRLGREAARAAPQDAADAAAYLGNYADVMLGRGQRFGSDDDLETAIRLGRRAVELTPAQDQGAVEGLSFLVDALTVRFGRFGAADDLEEAVGLARRAVGATPAGHPDVSRRLAMLAYTLVILVSETGAADGLDEAVAVSRRAAETVSADHGDRAAILATNAMALGARFHRFGAARDLDEAIVVFRAAVAALPAGAPPRAELIARLGAALRTRYDRFSEPGDLDEAVHTGRAAVDAAPPDHPVRAQLLASLALTLLRRFNALREAADLDEAVAATRRAVEITPRDQPSRADRLSDLSVALLVRFRAAGPVRDLDEAIRAARQAVRHRRDQPDLVFNLALQLAVRSRSGRRGRRAAAREAIALWEQLVERRLAPARQRVQAARLMTDLGGGSEPRRCAAALEAAVTLLPELAARHGERVDQEFALINVFGLASDAAAFALRDVSRPGPQRAVRALRLLETGRGVLLSEALDTRSDLTHLHAVAPDLAQRYVELCGLLDGHDENAPYDVTAARIAAARDFDALLAKVRALPGFAGFAALPDPAELIAQARGGPVVTFNVSDHGSDALLLTEDGISAVALPRLHSAELVAQIDRFHRVLMNEVGGADPAPRRAVETALRDRVEEAVRGWTDPAGRTRPTTGEPLLPDLAARATSRDADAAFPDAHQQDTLIEVLAWLWEVAAEPVLDALGIRGAPADGEPWPRVWWAPGGLLGLLPLHAAGRHGAQPSGAAVMDRVVSSYTPTIRALHHARQQAAAARVGPADADEQVRSLIVAMPTTPGLPGSAPLPFAAAEAALMAARLPGPVLLLEPDAGPAAPADSARTPTRDAVRELLPGCAIAHFACHGMSELVDPSRSRLLLHDHDTAPLTVAELAPVRLERAQLAYLSACRTAFGASRLLDESVHLASAFLLAGFPHVIAAAWEIADFLAPSVAADFYAGLTDRAGAEAGRINTDRAAEALHHTVRALRERYPDQPALWAAYLHVGA